MKAWVGQCLQVLKWWLTAWLKWVLLPWVWWRAWRRGTTQRQVPEPSTVQPRARRKRPRAFTEATYHHPTGHRNYKLYGAPAAGAQPVPLVVMLHGCKQSPDDFALGTRMNQHADSRGCMVLYPAQSRLANGYGCWNWFNPKDQVGEAGETALLGGMIRHVMDSHPVDPQQVVVLGLSAGAAMAVNLVCACPDLVRGVGVHSGLPYGAAQDAMAALKAMKEGASTVLDWPQESLAIPTIVFHGDSDEVVHPVNSEQLLAQRTGAPWQKTADSALQTPLSTPAQSETTPAGALRSYTRRVYLGHDGKTRHEHWLVHGAGHAWSGGDARGSYTDPAGPDATREMLRFLLGA